MNLDKDSISHLILGMREAYEKGENAMAWARKNVTSQENILASTLIAYDLQAGSYRDIATKNPKYFTDWSIQLAKLIRPYIKPSDSILEVGIGEATTLSGVIKELNLPDLKALGFDVSWSRIHVAQSWIAENSLQAKLFVADLFSIPLADNSVDVIYSSHSLEPNGGREEAAIKELFRVARKAVVLVEPIFELANEEAQMRMSQHGYVKGLKATAEKMNLKVVEYGLLDLCANSLNPSGVVLLLKNQEPILNGFDYNAAWQCPTTFSPMVDQGDLFYAKLAGIAYPIMRGIPMLRAEHGVVASKL